MGHEYVKRDNVSQQLHLHIPVEYNSGLPLNFSFSQALGLLNLSKNISNANGTREGDTICIDCISMWPGNSSSIVLEHFYGELMISCVREHIFKMPSGAQ